MVKRTLLVLAIAAGAIWWYEQARSPSLDTGQAAAQVSDSSNLDGTPVGGKGAAVRPAGGWAPKAWSVVAGKLVPGRALRDRFDSYLPLGKGVTMVEVRGALEQDAQADLGPDNAALVVSIWDRYARLQNHDWQHPFNAAEPKGWQATLNERHQVRRQFLGSDWAEAFFGDEEAAFQRRIAGLVAARRLGGGQRPEELLASAPASAGLMASGPTVVASAASGGSIGRDDSALRADRAKVEWTRLEQDVSLDEGQRLLRIRQYLQQNFSGPDAVRVERDLSLP